MERNNFLDYYKQIKQRIDIDIDFNRKALIGKTKLTYLNISKEISSKRLLLKLNAENMNIKSIGIYKSNTNTNEAQQNKTIITPLAYRYIYPGDVISYLKEIYHPIEDIESFKNLNRLEWENKSLGNLEIDIDTAMLYEGESFVNKFKIIVEYELDTNYIGVIFQTFYDEKMDLEHTICYTPNFYFNTAYWVPCHYDLKSQIIWNIYIMLKNDYSAYCSAQLVCIYQDTHSDKRAFHYKTKEPLCAKNLGFVALNEKIFNRSEDPSVKSLYLIANENKKERIEKNLIQNGLMNAIFSFYEEFFESDVTSPNPTFIIFIPYLAINSTFKFDRSVKSEDYFNMIKFPNLYILPEKLIYNDTIPDIVEFQLKNLGKLFISNYIGGLINEYSYSDFWLICGIENWLSDCFLQKCFGNNFIKDRLFNYIRRFRKICENGKEKRPLYTNFYNHPM
jgi:hypothetical protein